MGFILCEGKTVEVPSVEVQTWRFYPKLGFPRLKQRRETRAILLHHTGGSGNHEQVFRTLVQRNLSVHFVIDADGLIFQHCDTCVLASHCAGANTFSVGIEIVNPATTVSTELPRRTLVKEKIHAVDRTTTTFWPAQIASALALVDALCTHYGLPKRVPIDGTDVVATVLPDALLSNWRGVLGHLHVNPAKTDPGLAILRAVAAAPLRGKDGAAE